MEIILSLSTAEELKAHASAQLSECRERVDQIVGLQSPDAETTLRALNELFMQSGTVCCGVSLLRSVHPSPDLRRAAEEAEQEVASFMTEVGLHRQLFEAVRNCDPSSLDGVGQRLHRHLLRDFHRSGVDRDEETRAKVRRLRDELVELGQEFARNIISDVRSVQLEDVSELEGLPEDYVRGHAPDEQNTITITTDYPDYNPFMLYARSGKRRQELYRAFRSRAYPQNVPVLRRILERRYELATLLGYPSWAEYVAEDKMIESATAIEQFIERVSDVASKVSKEEYSRLLERKRRDDPDAAEVYDWEKGFYEELLRSEEFDVDSRHLRAYFNYSAVKGGIFSLVSELFGLEFRPVVDAVTWHEDVEVVDVYEDGDRVGRVYLDMHPREGKFKHAAMFHLVDGIRGGRPPEAALVCNFPKPNGDTPALLEHDDVVTFFHEFGHLLHHLSGRDQEWVEFSGTGTEWDFVEVPSQLMEEWAWDATVLESFSRHHESGEVIPSELVERLRRARDFGRGLLLRQQMYYATLSLKYHDTDPAGLDLDQLQRDLQNRYSRFRFVEGTYFHSSFGHLDGYSALYYTYMWSLVIEKDLFRQFKEGGIMDRATASRYRTTILAPGGSKDAAELIRDFLGRDYNFQAFEDWLNGR